jgi:hypothetical protein
MDNLSMLYEFHKTLLLRQNKLAYLSQARYVQFDVIIMCKGEVNILEQFTAP